MGHIKKCLPQLRAKISSMIHQKELELEGYGLDHLLEGGSVQKSALVLNLISKFVSSYCDMIDGRFVKESAMEYLGGSRINHIFTGIFTKTLEGIDPFDALSDDDIRTAIRNASGLRPNLFVPE